MTISPCPINPVISGTDLGFSLMLPRVELIVISAPRSASVSPMLQQHFRLPAFQCPESMRNKFTRQCRQRRDEPDRAANDIFISRSASVRKLQTGHWHAAGSCKSRSLMSVRWRWTRKSRWGFTETPCRAPMSSRPCGRVVRYALPSNSALFRLRGFRQFDRLLTLRANNQAPPPILAAKSSAELRCRHGTDVSWSARSGLVSRLKNCCCMFYSVSAAAMQSADQTVHAESFGVSSPSVPFSSYSAVIHESQTRNRRYRRTPADDLEPPDSAASDERDEISRARQPTRWSCVVFIHARVHQAK